MATKTVTHITDLRQRMLMINAIQIVAAFELGGMRTSLPSLW